MPTVKESLSKNRRYAWFLRKLMEEREKECQERLLSLNARQQKLKPVYEEFLHLYNLHIKPLQSDVDEYWENIHEIRKAEHFLQGQAEHREKEERARASEVNSSESAVHKGGSIALNNQNYVTTRLPYAGKSQAGRKPSNKELTQEQQMKEALNRLKNMNPADFAKLLKEVQG